MTLSLKDEILERLNLHKGGRNTASANIRKASHDFAKSDAPQFRGKSPQKRHQMAVAAGLSAARGESARPKAGDTLIYEGKKVLVQSLNESGLAVVKFSNRREPMIVRVSDLSQPKQLTEGIIGLAAIGPTYREENHYGFLKLDGLDPEDIGLVFEDDQEEDADNGSNVRADGHSGKTEVDALPTPSDTIAPAYSDEIAPKEISTPLSTQTGAEEAHLWDKPNWDGYDYPADAPEIPTAGFDGDDNGNSRSPHFDADEHQPGDGKEEVRKNPHVNDDDDGDVDEDRTDEAYLGFSKLENRLSHKKGIHNPGAVAASIGRKKYGKKNYQSHAAHHQKFHESMDFVTEIDNMLSHDREPSKDDTITVTLPAMASILVTVAHRMGADVQPGGDDEVMLKAMIEALDEVGQGTHSGCIDMPDLDAVAAHMNGEETHEIENREAGRPEHEGIAMHGDHGHADHGHPGHDAGHHPQGSEWPGDGDKSRMGKTKLMGGVEECEEVAEDYFGSDDVMAETLQLSDEEELRMIKRRAGLKFW